MAGGFVSPHSCNMPGCTRKTWNGQQGEQCCRTCKTSNGQSHGIDCNGKEDLRKALANSTSGAPSSTAKPAASSPFGAAAKPATQGAFGGGIGATTTPSKPGTCTFPPLGATTAASPFGAAVNPLTSSSAGRKQLWSSFFFQVFVFVCVFLVCCVVIHHWQSMLAKKKAAAEARQQQPCHDKA